MAETTGIKMKHSGIGIEYDDLGVRAVKIRRGDKGNFIVDQAEEIQGSFQKDEDRDVAIKELKGKLSIGPKDKIITCLSGKQIHASQFKFKLLAHDKMASALKIKIRKTIPFEVAGASIDYQVITKAEEKESESEILVSVAAKVLLNKQLLELEKQGLKPDIVDVQPLVIGNALSAVNATPLEKIPSVVMHVAPTLCTIIITGPHCSLFHRTIPFSGMELFATGKEEIPERERERRLQSLGEEIIRSLSYYNKNFKTHSFDRLFITGNFSDKEELTAALKDKTGLEISPLNLGSRAEEGGLTVTGNFDLAIATAMRCFNSGEINSFPFSTNLVAEMRAREKKAGAQRSRTFIYTSICCAVLVLSLFMAGIKVLTMEGILASERNQLKLLEEEYNTYAKTRLVVSKQDVELLDTLQKTRIFWTKKLATMAVHLPENYWITSFGFDEKEFEVSGFGYISKEQEQLITLDEYLNLMRKDTLFNDDFKNTYLDITAREDEGYRLRVNFNYSAVSSKTKLKGRPNNKKRNRRR